MQTALAAQHAAGLVPDLRRTGRLLRDPGRLATALLELDRERFAEEIGWLKSPAADEVSGLRGAANRCSKMIEGDGGDVLLPQPEVRRLDLFRALRDRDHVHFAVDVQAYPQLGPQVLSHFIAALVVATGRLRAQEQRVNGFAAIDEAGVLEGGQGRDLLERCGDVGVRTAWAPQSMSSIEERCGRAMRDALTENCNVVIAHRQSVQDAAQLLAAIAGTDEQLEHSHVVRDAVGPLGFDESGLRTRRLAEAFRSHPNRIKQLQAREVLLIEKDERLRVRFVRVRDIPPLDGDYIAGLRQRIGVE